MKQEASETRNVFGASAALRLRKTLATARRVSAKSADEEPARCSKSLQNAEPATGSSSSKVRERGESVTPLVAFAAASSSSGSRSEEATETLGVDHASLSSPAMRKLRAYVPTLRPYPMKDFSEARQIHQYHCAR